MPCSTFERMTCIISSCPLPNDKQKKRINLDTWKASRLVQWQSSVMHAVDLEHFRLSPEATTEVLLASQTLAEEVPPTGEKGVGADIALLGGRPVPRPPK